MNVQPQWDCVQMLLPTAYYSGCMDSFPYIPWTVSTEYSQLENALRGTIWTYSQWPVCAVPSTNSSSSKTGSNSVVQSTGSRNTSARGRKMHPTKRFRFDDPGQFRESSRSSSPSASSTCSSVKEDTGTSHSTTNYSSTSSQSASSSGSDNKQLFGKRQYAPYVSKSMPEISLNKIPQGQLLTVWTPPPPKRQFLQNISTSSSFRNPPVDLLQEGEWDQLSSSIWERFVQNEQTEEMYLRKMRLRDTLYSILQRKFPYCGLYVVGSSMNGFGANSSDIDMCLVVTQGELNQKREATEILMYIRRLLKEHSFIQKLDLIRAKVPILRFQDTVSNVEVDLNVNNSVGIRNTHLLHCYSKLDWRVGPLVLVVKLWARLHDINDAKNMTISSYSLALMVLHYLQFGCTPSVVPSLQTLYPDRFLPTQPLQNIDLKHSIPPYSSDNKQPLGELFCGFIEYYACKFDYKTDVISVRLGITLDRDSLHKRIGYNYHPHQWKFLCIEEPFDLSNTARSVFDEVAFQRIVQVFKKCHEQLKKNKELGLVLPS